MAENKEPNNPQKGVYSDPMKDEGDLQEVADVEDESTASGITGFLYFCNLERQKIRDEFPEWNTGEVGKELGRRWNDADDETRSKYVKIAINQRQRYERVAIVIKTYRKRLIPEGHQGSCSKKKNSNNEYENEGV